MGVKAKCTGLVIGLIGLTVVMLLFVWAVAKIGLIITGFLAGVVVGFIIGLAVRKK